MSHDVSYLGRQPILDRAGKVFGYELLARTGPSEGAEIRDPAVASAAVLIETFSNMGVQEVLGNKKGFVNFDINLIDEAALALFPKDRIVLELTIEDGQLQQALELCEKLHNDGYQIALDKFTPTKESLVLLNHVEYVKVDVFPLNTNQLHKFAKALKKFPPKMVALRVEDEAIADRCMGIGFDFFQGFYFAHPTILTSHQPETSKMLVIQLINQLMSGAELEELEKGFAQDIALSYKLLRMINSAGMTRGQEITSIRKALMILGRNPLYQWLTLLLFSGTSDEPMPELAVTAATRGRLAQLLGDNMDTLPLPMNEKSSQCFMLGMFTLLEALFKAPMELILKDLVIPEEMKKALLAREGALGDLLTLVEAIEQTKADEIQRIGIQYDIDAPTIRRCHLDAMAWVAAL